MTIDITGIGAIASAAKGIVDKFWPDKTEVEKAELAAQVQLTMEEYKLAEGQQQINLEEAKSTNWFVAGWRPYIGWVCGTGLAYQFLFMPIMNGFIKAIFDTVPFPTLDIGTLISCLTGLLGMGVLRTQEKLKNAEGNR